MVPSPPQARMRSRERTRPARALPSSSCCCRLSQIWRSTLSGRYSDRSNTCRANGRAVEKAGVKVRPAACKVQGALLNIWRWCLLPAAAHADGCSVAWPVGCTVHTCELPTARARTEASSGPTRPPERAFMNTTSGASSVSNSASGLVPIRNSGEILLLCCSGRERQHVVSER